jgi:hypothetical protein
VVSTRCRHYPGFRDLSGQQVRECTPRLERAGVLEKLKLEAQPGGIRTEIRRINLDHRSPPNMRSDQPLSLGDIGSLDHAAGSDAHRSTHRKVSKP